MYMFYNNIFQQLHALHELARETRKSRQEMYLLCNEDKIFLAFC